jgi:hypothetical protein
MTVNGFISSGLFVGERWLWTGDEVGIGIYTPAVPRALTATESLIASPLLEIQAGLELLDTSNVLIADISEFLLSGTVEHQNFADVHGTFRCELLGEYDWPNVRLRPYQIFTAGGYSETYYRGVYVPNRPATKLSTEPAVYDVSAQDLLSLLVGEIGDTYVAAQGTGYLAALQTLLAARVPGAACLFDTSAESTTMDRPKTWMLTSPGRTWLGSPCRDLTKAIGYNQLWCDEVGRLRTEPYQDPNTKTPVWTLDVSDSLTDITLPDRTLAEERSSDSRGAVNYWCFWMGDSSTLPVEGVNQYTVDRTGSALENPHTEELNVADYATLVIEGDRIVQEDSQVLRTIDPPVRALPVLGHLDVIRYKGDPRVGDVLAQVRSYAMPLRPSDGPTRLVLEIL